jgi:hypothetical protein
MQILRLSIVVTVSLIIPPSQPQVGPIICYDIKGEPTAYHPSIYVRLHICYFHIPFITLAAKGGTDHAVGIATER